jgi:hypothetical protein
MDWPNFFVGLINGSWRNWRSDERAGSDWQVYDSVYVAH